MLWADPYGPIPTNSISPLSLSDGATRDEIRTMLQALLADPHGQLQTVFEASPLRLLVNMLANTLGSPVVDKTGLDGLYDYTFEWPDSGSSLFASADLLGLKLEAKKVPVEILVMDRAEHPSAN